MPSWYLVIAFARVVADLYQKGLRMQMILSDVIKDIAFGTFIAFEGQQWGKVRQFTELGKKLTTAFMLISYPDIVITHNYETIKRNHYVYRLFKSHPYTAELLRQYELRNGILEEPTDIKEYYENIAGENIFLKMWNTIVDIAENIPDMFRKWSEVLVSLFHTKRKDPFAFASHIISEYAKKAETVKLYNTPADVVEYYSSYAPYLIPQLVSYATIFGVYEDILRSYSTMECDKGVFLKLPVPLMVNDKLLALGRPQSDFRVIWELPNKKLFHNLPEDVRNAKIDLIFVKTQYGDYIPVSCENLLEWVFFFSHLWKKDYTFDKENNILYISVDVKDYLKRIGIDVTNADPSDGVYVCVGSDCYYYEPKDWIYVLKEIAKQKPSTHYVNPYNGVVQFNLTELPAEGTPTEYIPTGKWIAGTNDLTKVPLAFFYNLAGFWVKWCSCINTNRMQVLRYRARYFEQYINPYYTLKAVEFLAEFTDPIINPPAPIQAGIRMFDLSFQGMYIAVINYIPIKCENGQPKEPEVPFIDLNFNQTKMHKLSWSDLDSYICLGEENRGMGYFIKSKWYWEWDLGTTMNDMRDLFNLVKSRGIWSYECNS
ncbi:MAG: hypothetical protein J7J28_04590 [Thaumarchaeota archaeon]|nr:hypothetical protein [Nitrososphaerota archaeon]